MPTTTNYGWTTPADTDLVKDGASAIRTLGTAIDTTVFNNASAAIAKTIVDAKGDLIAATAADTVARLAVGSNDQVLTADSSTATGLKWATPAAGGMTLISETVASTNSSLSFSSLGSYKQLLLIWGGVFTSDNTGFDFRFNNDSGANYFGDYWGLANTSPQNGYANGTSVGLDTFYSFLKYVTNGSVHNRGKGYLLLDNYTSSSKYKSYYGRVNFLEAEYSEKKSYNFDGVYGSQSAITSIDIVRTTGSGTFSNATNTTIRLYGVS